MRLRTWAAIPVALTLTACESPNALRDIAPEDLTRITRATVQVVSSEEPVGPGRADAIMDPSLVPTLVGGAVPVSPVAAGLGAAIAAGLIVAIITSDDEAQRREARALLAKSGNLPSREWAEAAVRSELAQLQGKGTRVRLEAFSFRQQSSTEDDIPQAKAGTTVVHLRVALHQHLSADLARLRMHFDVRGADGSGAAILRQSIHYLPVSVPGVTMEESLKSWSVNDHALYRQHLALAAAAFADSLDALLLSRSAQAQAALLDAAPVLRRATCYGGDYDAGIPMTEYAEGKLLPSRAEVTLVRLSSGAVLAFPACAPQE